MFIKLKLRERVHMPVTRKGAHGIYLVVSSMAFSVHIVSIEYRYMCVLCLMRCIRYVYVLNVCTQEDRNTSISFTEFNILWKTKSRYRV